MDARETLHELQSSSLPANWPVGLPEMSPSPESIVAAREQRGPQQGVKLVFPRFQLASLFQVMAPLCGLLAIWPVAPPLAVALGVPTLLGVLTTAHVVYAEARQQRLLSLVQRLDVFSQAFCMALLFMIPAAIMGFVGLCCGYMLASWLGAIGGLILAAAPVVAAMVRRLRDIRPAGQLMPVSVVDSSPADLGQLESSLSESSSFEDHNKVFR